MGDQMDKRVTMAQVADAAGVSQATVSIVLNNVHNISISDATRQRVRAAAELIGYKPRGRAALRAEQASIIGMVIDDVLTTPFAPLFLDGARERAAERGVIVATFTSSELIDAERQVAQSLLALNAVGLIYTSLMPRMAVIPKCFDALKTVLLNCYPESGTWPTVLCDDYDGAVRATEALFAAGHTRIAHMSGDPVHFAAQERERGYRDALKKHDLPVDESLIAIGGRPIRTALPDIGDRPLPAERQMPKSIGWTVSAAREAALLLLSQPDRPTAIFCFHDRMAYACYDVARELGLSIPRDLAIIGFDDDVMAEDMDPPLSTMRLPYAAMAARAVDMLLDDSPPAGTMHVPCKFLSRGSV